MRRPVQFVSLALAVLACAGLFWLLSPSENEPTHEWDAQMEGRAPELSGAAGGQRIEPGVRAQPPSSEGLHGHVMDFEGQRLPGATVRLAEAEAVTDDDGSFSLPEPAYDGEGHAGILVAQKEGFGTGQVPVFRDHPALIRIVLPRAAPISGVVRGSSAVISGARVVLHDGDVQLATTTDDDGRFTFTRARPGPCKILVTHAGYAPAMAEVVSHVRSRELTIHMRPQPDVGLYVVGPSGRPLAGAHVRALWERGGTRLLAGVSDERGFALRIPALHSPWAVEVSYGDVKMQHHLLPRYIDEDVTIQLREHTPLVVRLPATVSADEREAWSVCIASNRPAGGDEGPPYFGARPAQVGLEHGGGGWVSFDSEGEARLPAAALGSALSILAARRSARGHRSSLRLVIWRTDHLVAMDRAIEWTPPPLAQLLIKTVDARTGVATSVPVYIQAMSLDSDLEKQLPSSGVRSLHVRTGKDGVVRLNLLPGSYEVTAQDGHGAEARRVELAPEGAAVRLPVTTGHSVEGRLMTHDGIPLAGRLVTCSNGRVSRATHTDASGRFTLDSLLSGTYTLHYGGEHGASLHGPREIVVPSEAPLQLTSRSYELAGTLVPAPGRADIVWMKLAHGVNWFKVPVESDGSFRAPGLSRGPWILQVRRMTDGRTRIAAEREVTIDERSHVQIFVE